MDSIFLRVTAQGLASGLLPLWTILLHLLVLTTSCSVDHPEVSVTPATTGSPEADDATRLQPRVIRGYAVHAHEVRTFRPCGAADPLWVVGSADKLWSLHREFLPQPVSGRALFAVVEGREVAAPGDGFGADYAGGVAIDTVLYAGLEGPGCNTDWDAFDLKIVANEPFWSVTLDDVEARLSRLGHDDVAWLSVTGVPLDQGIRIFADHGAPGAMQLEVTREACRDSMSGAYFAFRGELQYQAQRLSGCALVGRQSLHW
jgi:uncharacterized membrane protein